MSTTLSMWLGITFVVLGVVAVLLQAILWNPDKYWDYEKKKTKAPRVWIWVHRLVGYAYATLYVVMMVEMVPRLWEYQVELPARTVIHAVMAITIGVILIVKVLIIRFFRWFEEAMPMLGFALLVCTINLAVLSVPFAIRGSDVSGSAFTEETRERVKRIVEGVEFGMPVDPEALTSPASLELGRQVLVEKCTTCHDMRTILIRPRTGNGWFDLVERMQEKPIVIGEPITDVDVPLVTAYLIAITPSLQESTQRRVQAEQARQEVAAEMDQTAAPADAGVPMIDADAAVTDGGTPGGDAAVAATPVVPAEPPVDSAVAQRLLDTKCTDCHGLDEIDEHGGDTLEGWRRIVRRMVVAEGAEVTDEEATLISRFLAQTHAP